MSRLGARVVAVGIAALSLLVSTACSSSGATRTVSAGVSSGNLSVVVTGDSAEVNSVPRCQWPLNILGSPSNAQVGLVRCYLKALADDSLNELVPLASAARETPLVLTRADLVHARDAASGTATATFSTNPSDPFDASIDVRFADGVRISLGMDAMNVNEPASHSWRLVDIGTPAPAPLFTGLPPATRD